MDRSLALFLTVLVGGGLALQAPVNAALGRDIGAVTAAAVSFFVGTLVLVGAAAARGDLAGLGGHPVWWHYVAGGLLGACYVLTATVTVRTLGAAGMITALVAGQLTAATIVDQFGLLGVERDPATWPKLVGLGLLAAGVALVTRS